MRLLLIIVFASHIFFGMENSVKQQLVFPAVIKEHSGLLRMLEQQGQSDFVKHPLTFPDGSFIRQEDINNFAQIYQQNFDCNQLCQDELISLAQYHDFFQMGVPATNVENALYQKLAQQELQWGDWKLLGSAWQCSLASLLIKNKRLDVQLLKLQSDELIANKKKIADNRRHHSVEELLFFNDQLQVYGESIWWFRATMKSQFRFTVKKDGKVESEVDVRRNRNRYWLEDILIHPYGLWALTYYRVHKEQKIIALTGRNKYVRIYDLFNLSTQEDNVVPDVTHVADNQNSSSVCCFGKNCFYSAACYGDANIIVRSTDLVTKKEIDIVTLYGSEEQKVIAITSDKDGTKLAVATYKSLFIITIGDYVDYVRYGSFSYDVLNDYKSAIKHLSLNNQGTMLCVVTKPILTNIDDYDEFHGPAKVYLCTIIGKDISAVEITNELQGNQDLKKYEWSVNRVFLSHIEYLHWSHDDSFLLLQCGYRYENIYQGRMRNSSYVGNQYAFICSATGNGWSESETKDYNKRVVTSNDGRAIITDKSSWFTHTQSLKWYDEHMVQALNYFDIEKSDEMFSSEKKSTGIVLLYKILQNRYAVMQLNKEESAIYNDDMSDAIKMLLNKRCIILPYKEIISRYAALQQWIYIQALRCKNFLYNYRKPFIFSIGALLFAVYSQHYIFTYENLLLSANSNRFGIVGAIDTHVISTIAKILK